LPVTDSAVDRAGRDIALLCLGEDRVNEICAKGSKWVIFCGACAGHLASGATLGASAPFTPRGNVDIVGAWAGVARLLLGQGRADDATSLSFGHDYAGASLVTRATLSIAEAPCTPTSYNAIDRTIVGVAVTFVNGRTTLETTVLSMANNCPRAALVTACA
jgi:hypothetical protein